MQSFFSNYLALAGPAVIGALVASTIAYFLLGGRDLSFPGALLWKVAGSGVVSAVLVSVVLALFGYTTSYIPTLLGVVVGVVAAFRLRPPPAA